MAKIIIQNYTKLNDKNAIAHNKIKTKSKTKTTITITQNFCTCVCICVHVCFYCTNDRQFLYNTCTLFHFITFLFSFFFRVVLLYEGCQRQLFSFHFISLGFALHTRISIFLIAFCELARRELHFMALQRKQNAR